MEFPASNTWEYTSTTPLPGVNTTSSTAVFLEEALGSGAELQHPQFLLQVCCGEHTDCLHLCVELQLHCGREAGTAQHQVEVHQGDEQLLFPDAVRLLNSTQPPRL